MNQQLMYVNTNRTPWGTFDINPSPSKSRANLIARGFNPNDISLKKWAESVESKRIFLY